MQDQSRRLTFLRGSFFAPVIDANDPVGVASVAKMLVRRSANQAKEYPK
jgi:hypothetical protein